MSNWNIKIGYKSWFFLSIFILGVKNHNFKLILCKLSYFGHKMQSIQKMCTVVLMYLFWVHFGLRIIWYFKMTKKSLRFLIPFWKSPHPNKHLQVTVKKSNGIENAWSRIQRNCSITLFSRITPKKSFVWNTLFPESVMVSRKTMIKITFFVLLIFLAVQKN